MLVGLSKHGESGVDEALEMEALVDAMDVDSVDLSFKESFIGLFRSGRHLVVLVVERTKRFKVGGRRWSTYTRSFDIIIIIIIIVLRYVVEMEYCTREVKGKRDAYDSINQCHKCHCQDEIRLHGVSMRRRKKHAIWKYALGVALDIGFFLTNK
ncbi:hypothetical protein Tco_0008557 [Tanacetum coccineum]